MSDEVKAPDGGLEPEEKPQVPGLFRNYISFIGFAIAAASLISIALLFLIEITSGSENPYTVLVTYILLPSVLVFGLAVAVVGALLERRRRRKYPESGLAAYPVLDLNDPARRRSLVVFMCVLFAFLFMSAFGSYRAFEYTESTAFCGQQCHTVMKPEFVAYQASPHARVACVECHVGGGAEWYVRSKLNGMNQLYAVTFRTYDKPIKTPVHNMRPADETCAKCHWPEKFIGDQLRVFDHFGYDEKNSLNRTRMLIKVGGGSPAAGPAGGIHWHMNVSNEVTYIATDDQRQNIPWVRLKDPQGNVTEYQVREGALSQSQIDSMPRRRMDCIDCHNRPAHIYLSPNEAVDRSLSAGRLDQALPFIKAKSVEVLAGNYPDNDTALAQIASRLTGYYRETYPDIFASRNASIVQAVAELQSIYQTNFFPEMRTNWSSHINNIGHLTAQGCFRCHDGRHFSREGKVIRNDCAICHTTIDQSFGGSTLIPENNVFKHPVDLGDKNTYQCAACHTGDRTFVHPLNLGDISRFQCSECHTGNYEKVKF
ncbi:MAG: NapC/NirT family cytochrome c [Chloracidobacterium sp.]|nr:NapC/NirT family cytochrome c [Chloracidobacterium sp.]